MNYPPIACLAFTPWKGNYAKSTTQLINRLAEKHAVLYIDYQFTFKDVLNRVLGKNDLDIGPIVGYKKRLRKEITPLGTEVYVLSLPPVIPINWISSNKLFLFGLRINSFLIRKKIKNALKVLKMEKPVFVSAYNPFIGLFSVGKFNESLHAYYCYDEISGSPWAQKHGASVEKDYIKKVDLVMTSSKALQQSKSQINKNCELIANGVDFKYFNDFYNEHGGTKKTDQNIIGYIGSLDERIDYELIKDVANAFPSYEIRLIGRVVFPDLLECIKDVKNINLVGPKPYAELASELFDFSIGLIPFLKTRFTKNIYPLKINEYLSMAKPVVKTNFAELPEFNSLVYTGNTTSEFVDLIKKGLAENEHFMQAERIEMARSNAWSTRVDKFSQLISSPLV